MILKMFDTKSRATLDFLWALSSCFKCTAFVKPYTSRPANSERYWIGKDYGGAPNWIIQLFRTLTATDASSGWTQLFKEIPVFPPAWITGVQAFQEQVELHQFNKIQLTLNLIRTPSRDIIQNLLIQNIRNSRAWCIKHRIPLNPRYAGLSDEQVASLNLEEALGPFQVSVGRMNSLGLSRPPPTHRVLTLPLPQRPPAGPAWRTALPASVLGREPFQTVSGSSLFRGPAPSQSLRDSGPVSEPL